MSTCDDCQCAALMGFINNRMNDVAFLSGLGANIVGQLALFTQDPKPAIYTTGTSLYTNVMTIFNTDASDQTTIRAAYKSLGTEIMNFLGVTFNSKTSRVNTALKTY